MDVLFRNMPDVERLCQVDFSIVHVGKVHYLFKGVFDIIFPNWLVL